MSRVKISEICDVFDGPHATPTKIENGPIYLGIDAITDDGKINTSGFNYLSEEDYIKWTKRVTPRYGDIVFSYEATLGRYALIPKGFRGCLGRRLAVVRPKDERINVKWLFYYFRSMEWTVFIKNNTVKGSTVDRISIEDFPGYTIPLIERKEQDRIVNVLSAIDDRIDNNVKINDNLSKQTELLFQHWFTQFDFPDSNGNPYKTSNGNMSFSSTLNMDIPESWDEVLLGDKCECLLGGTPRRKESQYWNGHINWITSGKVNEFRITEPSEKITELGLKNTSTYLLPKNTTVLAITGATMGQVSILNIEACTNQSVVGILETESIKTEYIYYLIISSLKGLLNQKAGAAQPHINKDNIKNIRFPLPPKDVLEQYYKCVHPLFEKIMKNEDEIVKLIKLRDWLLPMLMNGQATIED